MEAFFLVGGASCGEAFYRRSFLGVELPGALSLWENLLKGRSFLGEELHGGGASQNFILYGEFLGDLFLWEELPMEKLSIGGVFWGWSFLEPLSYV